jgi:hypothetical protein
MQLSSILWQQKIASRTEQGGKVFLSHALIAFDPAASSGC